MGCLRETPNIKERQRERQRHRERRRERERKPTWDV